MKKIWKILGAAAVVAGLTPYKMEHDVLSDEKTWQALLWKITSKPDPERDGNRLVSVDIGFRNPLDKSLEEAEHYADHLQEELDCSAGEAPAEDSVTEEYGPDDVLPF